jgi:hypothetical protein
MPVAIPTWRKVVLMPEAIPDRCGGTTPTAVDASGGLIRPTPAPATRKPASSAVQSEFTVRPCMRSSPAETSTSPTPISARTGTVLDSRPAIGATKNDISVIGRKRRPASSGE